MKTVDLHTHSTASDGADSPAELVAQASSLGLAALALTDHDTICGLEEAQGAARNTGLELIRGCEISTAKGDIRMHILGLWLPENCHPLEDFLRHLWERREKRNELIIQRFRAHGVDISLEEVRAKATFSVGRPHFAAVLQEKGYVKDRQEAFNQWLSAGGKAYVPKEAPTPHDAVRLLASLGASPIIAHPLLDSSARAYLRGMVAELSHCGLFGLEAWHSEQSPEKTREILALAEEFNLAVSGGSDYHGANKPHIALASGRGQLQVPLSVLDNMKKRRIAQGLPV